MYSLLRASRRPHRAGFASARHYSLRPTPTTKWVAALPLAVASAYLIDEYYYAAVLRRSVRAVYVLSLVAYKYSRPHDAASMEELHEEASEMLVQMIRGNKGLYIKMGQALANQGALFPLAYQKRFSKLFDDAPNDPWGALDATLRAALGPDYESRVFDHIQHEPMASALIAQVHKARLRAEDALVAVKVQHPYIPRQMTADLLVYRLMSRVYERVFDLPISFFTAYISEQLEMEADFTRELRNSGELARFISNDRSVRSLNVYVPYNYPQYSSERVLVTEWIEGVPLTDKQRLIDKGYSLDRLMRQYITIFCRQTFSYGFVHADPHPGNMLVRMSNGSQQLVILDHGLYTRLPKKFMLEYRDLWQNILGASSAKIDHVTHEWGIGSAEILKAVIQLKPPEGLTPENAPSHQELIRMFLGDERKFPQELIFLMRAMRMMQNLNQTMGSPVNRINLIVSCAMRGAYSDCHTLRDWAQLVSAKLALLASDIVFWVFRARQILHGDRYGDKGEGIEDYINAYLQQNLKSLGIDLSYDA